MSEPIDIPHLRERLGTSNLKLWSILDELAGQGEDVLRVTLRAHDEAGFDLRNQADTNVILQRRRLDRALDALTQIEIACETGHIAYGEIVGPNFASLQFLFASEAFFRYVDVYLYFGVRLLAGRLCPPVWWNPELKITIDRHRNQRSFPLAVPPPVKSPTFDAPIEEFLVLLSNDEADEALEFLDDFHVDGKESGNYDREEPANYELWLRGLYPAIEESQGARFRKITDGLIAWCRARTKFYLGLQPLDGPPVKSFHGERTERTSTSWIVGNPFAARFALADIYWLARILRAEVSSAGRVTYARTSWLHLLRFYATLNGMPPLVQELGRFEDVLRPVFGFVCDLVQNAAEISDERECRFFKPEAYIVPPSSNRQWREVFDEELGEIDRQRAVRTFAPIPVDSGQAGPSPNQNPTSPDAGWSRRVVTGKHVPRRIGLAFSGGGIRSATFNLGVLQGLQEFDLLRQIDYLSTVSGGGFIGAWLAGNVKKTSTWLGKDTSWDESIDHLRSYSNYLSPLSGIFSADSWTIAASWARNTFLIQLTGLTWLVALLLVALETLNIFRVMMEKYPGASFKVPQILGLPTKYLPYAVLLCAVMGALLTGSLCYNLFKDRTVTGKKAPQTRLVRWLAVLPAWVGSYTLAAMLWSNALTVSAFYDPLGEVGFYSHILQNAFRDFPFLLILNWTALLAIGCSALIPWKRPKPKTVFIAVLRSFGCATFCVGVFYLELCGIIYLFLHNTDNTQRFTNFAFVCGPALIGTAFTISVVVFIGLSGRVSNESQREWWTRLGAWLAIYAVVGFGWSAITVLGPWLVIKLATIHWKIATATITGGLGTVISGLFAGKSSKTAGDSTGNKSPWLEILAKIGGALFILLSVLTAATVLYLVLRNFADPGLQFIDYWGNLTTISPSAVHMSLLAVVFLGVIFSWCFEINIFSLNQFYRNRLVRCYLGATRWTPGIRKPHPFTGFDFEDDMRLCELRDDFRGPFPIFNCALNLAGSSDLALKTRHSASFILTPLRCGNDRPKVGYAPTSEVPADGKARNFAHGVMLGQAVSISGAAASPNMGYNTSPLVAFLLTMFNVRLGWWFPNPGQSRWDNRGLPFSLYYLTRELLGMADETRDFLNVSDGGHFENLGIYELVRRRCEVIIAADAECDELLQFGGLGNLIRICETDFGAIIDIDVKSIREQKQGVSLAHCAVGTIKYSNGDLGYLIYLKASVSGDEAVSITQYRSSHPSFPHESTANQFFTEDQFESYRKLGQHVVQHSFRGTRPGDHPGAVARRLFDVLVPAGCSSESFIKHAHTLQCIWESFRKSPILHSFIDELMAIAPPVAYVPPNGEPVSLHQSSEELCMGLELLQLMEDVFMDLRMDDFWEHPDNRGWAIMFMRWARSRRFQAIWKQTKRTYGIRFEYFCSARLGLTRDKPIARV